MAYDYAPIADTAARLITKFGAPMTFRAAASTPDPVTGLGGTVGITRVIQGLQTKFDETTFPDTRIQLGDRAFLLEGAAVQMTDKFIDGPAEWSIQAIANIQPNGADIVAVKILVRA